MKSKLSLALITVGVLALVAAAVFTVIGKTSGPATSNPEKPQAIAFKPGNKLSFEVLDKGYVKLTNTGKDAPQYLEFQPTTTPPGSVAIERCAKPFTAKGECSAGSLTVLPVVDLGGWKTALAAANTTLNPGETGYYKFAVKTKSKEPVEFKATAKK